MAKIVDLDDYRRNASADALGTSPRRAFCSRKGMRELLEVRERIRAEAESLTGYYQEPRPKRDDEFDMRIARASYAIYLLETIERMLHVVDKRGEPSLAASFQSAIKAVKEFLKEPYFQKSVQGILDAFGKMDGPLGACAERCGVMLHLPEQAVEQCKMKFADMIDAALGRKHGDKA